MISWFWNWYHIWNWYAGSRLYFYLEILWLRIGERDAFCFTTPYFPWGHGNSCLQVVYFSHTHTHPCSVMSDSETSWTVTCQAPLCMGFPRQEYWSGLPFPPPGDLPDPGIEPSSPTSTIENNACCGLVIYGLYFVEVGPLYPRFLESFYHKWVLNFVKSFFFIYWDDYVFFIL